MENNQTQNIKANAVPLWEKYTLTIREAAEYFNIGEKRLRRIVDENPNADFIVMNGNRAMFKRKLFEKYVDEAGVIHQPERFADQDAAAKRTLLHSRMLTIPDDWLVCNGFILPVNYIDVPRFENIYQTHNRFRVWTSSPKKREEEMNLRMAEYRGVTFEDLEARKLCGDLCKQLYGTRDPRRLSGTQRIALAQQLRDQYRLTFRQLSTLVRLPETEIRAHVR